ncbi:chorismate-binding protein [Rhodomicrobium lacus]|uniref:chorismate-binding protein n=1 Tax=Rhodomicrobium lacus TaxID=2498452 RepID=UPI0026E248C8|nr:chorismate-binding protein [Rhodomicrobium lacus]WKW49661.1 chorismate-binding protein [Rhodomicrobium lacus]
MPVLRAAENHAQQGRWALGFVAYEAAAAFDRALTTFAPDPRFPLAAFAVFDAPKPWQEAAAIFACSGWGADMTRAAYSEKIAAIRDGIADGAHYQVNLTMRLASRFDGDPRGLFDALRRAQPHAYALYLDFGDCSALRWQIASVSPELFFAWEPRTRAILTRPMKGTAHADAPPDALLASPKERAENLMIVDLLRNDIARVAVDGTVSVPKLFAIEKLSTVQQMTSTVTGTARPRTALADIFAALFPCGSVTGAPKIAAMKSIAALETGPRGPYCGALGVIEPGGAATFSVGIRTVAIANGTATCGVGSGVTWDSNATDEYEECIMKRRFLLRASAPFELLETMKIDDGAIVLLHRHMARLARAAEHFGFPLDEDEVRRAVAAICADHATGAHRLRLLLSREGALKLESGPLPVTPADTFVVFAQSPVSSDDEFLRHKTTNRAVYEAHAPKDGAVFDTLLFNERGEITEFTRGNVAIMRNGKLVTPAETCGLLPGTLRAELLARGDVSEDVLTRKDIIEASNVMFLNTLRGLISVRLRFQ